MSDRNRPVFIVDDSFTVITTAADSAEAEKIAKDLEPGEYRIVRLVKPITVREVPARKQVVVGESTITRPRH